jgi:hypothetical protein
MLRKMNQLIQKPAFVLKALDLSSVLSCFIRVCNKEINLKHDEGVEGEKM